jgi:hypothetical protein
MQRLAKGHRWSKIPVLLEEDGCFELVISRASQAGGRGFESLLPLSTIYDESGDCRDSFRTVRQSGALPTRDILRAGWSPSDFKSKVAPTGRVLDGRTATFPTARAARRRLESRSRLASQRRRAFRGRALEADGL